MRAMLLLAMGCKPAPGTPDYPELTPWVDTANPLLEGFTPFDPAVQRLDLGVYYEGPSSERVPVDGVTAHFYIYESTFSQMGAEDHIEGYQADLITVGSVGWWGGGVHWDNPRDLTGYQTLHLGLRATDPSFASLTAGMVAGIEARVPVTDHGFAADGEWHSVSIPLEVLVGRGADLTNVTVPLVLIAAGSNAGTELLIDDVYISGGAP